MLSFLRIPAVILGCLAGIGMLPAQAGPGPAFDPAAFTVQRGQVGERTFTFRVYEGLPTVEHPVDAVHQALNLYVPTALLEGGEAGPWRKDTAPLLLMIAVDDFLPSLPVRPGKGRDGRPNAVLQALARGLVVAAPATRGRTTRGQDGRFTGKAPAALLDLKAAVRFLRTHAGKVAGAPERIIAQGSGAGGGLAALLGATGNSRDYEAGLKALGAADARDDVFGVACDGPVTNLDHADMAAAWQFEGLETGTGPEGMARLRLSRTLTAAFPAYVNGLDLKDEAGRPLGLEPDGTGTFRDHLAALVVASAQGELDRGRSLGRRPWIRVQGGKVLSVDLEGLFRAMGRPGPLLAFDGADRKTPENGVFGSETVDAQHFTPFGFRHGRPGGSLADAGIVASMNPMAYLLPGRSMVAPLWRIRQGVLDSRTPLAIPVLLAARLRDLGVRVDLALAWGDFRPDGADPEELLAWVERACR